MLFLVSAPVSPYFTVEEDLRDLNDQSNVAEVLADPPAPIDHDITGCRHSDPRVRPDASQLHAYGQTLFDLLTGLNLVLYPAEGIAVRNLYVLRCARRENAVGVGQGIFQRPEHQRR